MTGHERPAVADALARLAGAGSDAIRVADAVGATWQRIEAALMPIIGIHGVAALYQRSHHLTRQAHPWLAEGRADMQAAVDLDALKSALVGRSALDAAAAGGALLQTFYELLVSLVGPSLSSRLLHFLWQPLEQAPDVRPNSS